MIRSNGTARARARPDSPSPWISTSKPSAVRPRSTPPATLGSSSTTSTRTPTGSRTAALSGGAARPAGSGFFGDVAVEAEQEQVVGRLHRAADDQRPAERAVVQEDAAQQRGGRGGEAPRHVGDAGRRGPLLGRDDGHDERLPSGHVELGDHGAGQEE